MKTSTKTEYRKYIESEGWQQRRKDYLATSSECNRCSLPRWAVVMAYDQDLNVHHRSYANLGNEHIEDLEALCRRCHEIETFGRSALHAVKIYDCSLCNGITFNPWLGLCDICRSQCGGPIPSLMTQVNPMSGRIFWEQWVRAIAWYVGTTAVLDNLANYDADQRRRGYDPTKTVFEKGFRLVTGA